MASEPRQRQRIEAVENRINTPQQGILALAFAGAGVFIMLRFDPVPGAVFALIGAYLLAGVIRTELGRRKYGAVFLELEVPVVPGGPLRATLVSSRPVAGGSSVAAHLRCLRGEWVGSARNRRIEEHLVWSTHATFPLIERSGRSEAEIQFALPGEALVSQAASDAHAARQRPGIFWEVKVGAATPGVDLMRSFLVTVGTPPTGVGYADKEE